MSNLAPGTQTARRSCVLAWALWDCGSTGLIAVVNTFVLTVDLTGRVGAGEPGGTQAPVP